MCRTQVKYKNGKKKQQGLVVVLLIMVFIFLVGFAALSIDVNHVVLNKSRVQNAVDSAALAGALVGDKQKSESDARTAAKNAFTNVVNASGNTELSGTSEDIVIVQFSNDPEDFPSNGSDQTGFDESGEIYIRVSVDDVSLDSFLVHLFSQSKFVGASAVAGPSPPIVVTCNLVPLGVCAGDESAPDFWGFKKEQVYVLKDSDSQDGTMGPGNYQLLDFGSGASDLEKYLAGDFEECMGVGDTVDTKPGASTGAMDGLNTRFGEYKGNMKKYQDTYLPDIYAKQPDTPAVIATDDVTGEESVDYDPDAEGNLDYADYVEDSPGCVNPDLIDDDINPDTDECYAPPLGKADRRILPIPILACDPDEGGGVNTYDIEAIGCFFLLQQVATNNSGKNSVPGAIFGEFIDNCSVLNGSDDPGNSDTEGLKRIQLYKDPLSGGA